MPADRPFLLNKHSAGLIADEIRGPGLPRAPVASRLPNLPPFLAVLLGHLFFAYGEAFSRGKFSRRREEAFVICA